MTTVTSVAPETVMAVAVLKANEAGESLEIEDISKKLLELQDLGIDVGEVALRRVPDGVYSEDVEAFVGRLLAAGYAKARSPIKFFDNGLRVCKMILEDEQRENLEGLRAVASALSFDLSKFTGPEAQ
ncbi:MAG: hypothetical protein ABSG25_16090 [Bryobacteraceae bacterium]